MNKINIENPQLCYIIAHIYVPIYELQYMNVHICNILVYMFSTHIILCHLSVKASLISNQ